MKPYLALDGQCLLKNLHCLTNHKIFHFNSVQVGKAVKSQLWGDARCEVTDVKLVLSVLMCMRRVLCPNLTVSVLSHVLFRHNYVLKVQPLPDEDVVEWVLN